MKKWGLIFILFIYASTQVGSVISYFSRPVLHCISLLKQHSWFNSESHLTEVCMDKKIFLKLKVEKNEILWNGSYYDIERIFPAGPDIRIIMKIDNDETRWMAIYTIVSKWLNKDSSSEKSWAKALIKWLNKIYSFPSAASQINLFPLTRSLIKLLNVTCPKSPLHQYTGQPPKCRVLPLVNNAG